MAHINVPRPPFRWQAGLLLLSLPRRFIASGLRDLPPGGADQSLPHPSGDADPRQLGGLTDQVFVLLKQPETEGSGLSLISLWSSHAESVGPITLQVKRKKPALSLLTCRVFWPTITPDQRTNNGRHGPQQLPELPHLRRADDRLGKGSGGQRSPEVQGVRQDVRHHPGPASGSHEALYGEGYALPIPSH